MDDPSSKVELYFKSIDMYQQQRELYWTRISAFLVLHGLLFTAASFAQEDRWLIVSISIFGVVFSIIWLVVMYYGDVHIQNWQYVVSKLEYDLEDYYDGRTLLDLTFEAGTPGPRIWIPSILQERAFMVEQYLPPLAIGLWVIISIFITID